MADQQTPLSLGHRIRELLRKRGNRLLAAREIHERLKENSPSLTTGRDDVERELADLERQGEIVPMRGKRYSLVEFTPFITGRVRSRTDGTLSIRRSGEPDVVIDRRRTRGAMNGDLVLVRTGQARAARGRGGRDSVEGEIVRVLERVHEHVVARFHAGDSPWAVPFDTRLEQEIDIELDQTGDARDGEMVNVELVSYGDHNRRPRGRVVERIGMLGDPGVDVEVVIRKHHLPHRFPDEVLEAAERIPEEVESGALEGRTDLRERRIITIDSETARDFDDAVEVLPYKGGGWTLGVHIADVSHYVKPGDAVDREAYDRATSVYFPDRVVPMLPERLSNGICSLKPGVERLTFSVEVDFDSKGRIGDRRIYRSVIRSAERMTYTDVHALLERDDAALREKYAHLLDDLLRMRELFEVLRARRDARGSIDFDLPESEVLIGEQGEIETIRPSARNIAHRLIEEFMLVANEVVASTLAHSAQPGIFRVHEPPDAMRIEDLKEIVAEFGHKLRANPEHLRPADLQRLLADIAGTAEERFVAEFVLRAMKRAMYLEENRGHFALALQDYCHFTSPIRRYPDLIVHRRLGELIAQGAAWGETLEKLTSAHPQIARQSSERERRAEEAEREALEWKKVLFMRDKVGQEFDGRITGVVGFGVFVELEEYFVQGLVPVASIGGDYWVHHEREHRLRGESTGRELRLGESVRIRLEEVNEDRRQLAFSLQSVGGRRLPWRRTSR